MRIFTMVLLLSTMISCRKGTVETIPVIDTQAENPVPQNLSQVFDKINFLRLETNDLFLISNIRHIAKTKDYIFITESKRILQFDASGLFLKQIGSYGQGPGEHEGVYRIAVDSNANRLIIAGIDRLLCYDFDGKLIQYIPTILNSVPEYISFVNGNLWFFITSLSVISNENSNKYLHSGHLLRYNNILQVTDSMTIHQIKLITPAEATHNNNFFLSEIESGTFIYYPVIIIKDPILRDTLYEVQGSKMIPALKLDFSGISSTSKANLENGFRKKSITIYNIYRTDRFVFSEYESLGQNFTFCYDLLQKKGCHMPDGFTDDLFGTGKPVQLIPLNLRKGEFCFVRNGYELDGIIDGVDESSNPVVFFMRTKE